MKATEIGCPQLYHRCCWYAAAGVRGHAKHPHTLIQGYRQAFWAAQLSALLLSTILPGWDGEPASRGLGWWRQQKNKATRHLDSKIVPTSWTAQLSALVRALQPPAQTPTIFLLPLLVRGHSGSALILPLRRPLPKRLHCLRGCASEPHENPRRPLPLKFAA